MKSKTDLNAAILSAFGAFQFLAAWYLLLFYAQPGHQSIWTEAWDIAISTLSSENPNSWFFISMLVSIAISVTCILLFLVTNFGAWIMTLVAIHSIVAFFIYDIGTTIVFAMPLIMLPYYFSDRLKSA